MAPISQKLSRATCRGLLVWKKIQYQFTLPF